MTFSSAGLIGGAIGLVLAIGAGTPPHPVACSTIATMTISANESGRKTFQPSRISWS